MDFRTREIIHTFKGIADKDRLCGSVICLKRKFDFSARQNVKKRERSPGFFPPLDFLPDVIICVGGRKYKFGILGRKTSKTIFSDLVFLLPSGKIPGEKNNGNTITIHESSE